MAGQHGDNLVSLLATAVIPLVLIQQHFTQVYAIELNPDWYSCRIEFKDKDAKIKAIVDCATKHNYKIPSDDTIEAIKEEMTRLTSNDFDDSCFSKCWYESNNMIKDGKINIADMGDFFKNSNMTQTLLKEYTKLIGDCVKETEPKFKDAKETPCKMYTMVDVCSFKKFEENKKHLEEVCNKST